MSEKPRAPQPPAETPPPDDEPRKIKIDRETLEASQTEEGQALLEYGAAYEKQLEEEGLIHP